jgi:hypothetical protein
LTVTYDVCLEYDPNKVHRAGSTIPVRLHLCNASGANVSGSPVIVNAVGLQRLTSATTGPVEDSGNANPDGNFRLVGGPSYLFNLSTRGLVQGTYELLFTVTGDPVTHRARFQIR